MAINLRTPRPVRPQPPDGPPPNPAYRIGLAVSGGADSTALLVLMAGWQAAFGFKAFVLHVDHGLRPDSADDARFVGELAKRFRLPFHALKTRVVRRPRESLEMAARRVRLAFFSDMARRLRLDAIATGHHADDVAETFMLRLARGSGPDGLAGLKQISHVNGLTFIRPLLNIRDAELRKFLRDRGQPWREDATNADTSILRNRVRHVILPFLREHLDARISEHLCKSAAILRGDLRRPCPPRRRAADDVPDDAQKPPEYSLVVAPARGYAVQPAAIGALPAACELSRAALAGRTLELRPWRAGDRIAPHGMGGRSRKLQDVYVTAKVPPRIRATLPVLADAQTGEILWVPGYRIAESVAAPSQTAPTWRFTLRRR
ncbi:MAG: tRNA lysidine(34) synthetase TilS [Kiritimatiellia bacterium]